MSADTRRMMRSPLFWVVAVAVTWFSITFLLWPTIQVVTSVLAPDGSLSLRAVQRLSASERATSSLRNSFVLAGILAVTVNVVGVFLVLVTRYFAIVGARLLWLGYASTLVYGGVVMAAGYQLVYGRNGFVTRQLLRALPDLDPSWFSGLPAVVAVMTVAGTGFHLLFLGHALAKVDQQTIEAAQQMGASSWTVLWRIVLPTLLPMLSAVTVLTFLGGLGALAVPQVLGGPEFQTIAPMILTFASSPQSRDLAATLALVLGLATVVLVAVLNRLERDGTYFSVSKVPSALVRQPIRNPVANGLVHLLAYLLFVGYALPPLLIVLFSFTDAASIASARISLDSLTLANYHRVLTDDRALWPFVVSVGYSAVATVIVVAGLFFVARLVQKYRNPVTVAVEYVLHLPWVLPSTLVALGLILAYDHPSPLVFDVVLTGTVGLLVIAYVVAKVPFTLRLFKAAFGSVPRQLEEAAAILGASSLTTYRRVLLPVVAPTVAAVAALNFNSLLDDYDSAVFLSHPLYPPLGLVIKNATSGEATSDTTALTFVYTVVLMVITGLTMWLVYGRGAARPRPGRRSRGTPPIHRRRPLRSTRPLRGEPDVRSTPVP